MRIDCSLFFIQSLVRLYAEFCYGCYHFTFHLRTQGIGVADTVFIVLYFLSGYPGIWTGFSIAPIGVSDRGYLCCGSYVVRLAKTWLWSKENDFITEANKALCTKTVVLFCVWGAGISCAMFIGQAFHLTKPLWISIVVMSLTKPEFQHTIQYMKYRFAGTVIGSICFLVFCCWLIPDDDTIYLILFIGFITMFSFAKQYKYQQIANAINALNASLVLFDASVAIKNRIFCLFDGIAIVLGMHLADRWYQSRLPIWRKKKETFMADLPQLEGHVW